MENYEINLRKKNKKSNLKQNFCIQNYKVNLKSHFTIYNFDKKKKFFCKHEKILQLLKNIVKTVTNFSKVVNY